MVNQNYLNNLPQNTLNIITYIDDYFDYKLKFNKPGIKDNKLIINLEHTLED